MFKGWQLANGKWQCTFIPFNIASSMGCHQNFVGRCYGVYARLELKLSSSCFNFRQFIIGVILILKDGFSILQLCGFSLLMGGKVL